jgi:nucleoid DNA-binding protein
VRYVFANTTLVKYFFSLDLAPYIHELILLNECVILPGFGGFETEYQAAHYDNTHKRMLPPTKKVLFRPDFLTGSGVFELHLQKHLKIDEKEAIQYIDTYVDNLKNQLEVNREALIEGVGLFTKGLGNNISFTAFEEENYLVDSFGLEALPFESKIAEEKTEPKKELKIRPRSNTLLFLVVGIIIISILLAITITISARFDVYLFDMGKSKVENELIIIGGSNSSDSTYQQINKTLDQSTDLKSALFYTESNSVNEESTEKQNQYYLVAGSFKAHINAELTFKQLVGEGYSPEIIEYQSYHRVTIGNFNIKQEALRELQRLRRQLDRSVWLLTVSSNPS